MKVSYNRGADLMTCLAAVKAGSTDCDQGLVAEVKTVTELGVSKDARVPLRRRRLQRPEPGHPDGARHLLPGRRPQAPYAQALFDSLPILGKDGTLANVLTDSPAAGKAQIKTGNRVAGTPADQMIVLGNSLAGYIEAKSGRQLTFMVGVDNVPIATPAEFEQVTGDQAKMAVAIQQSF